MSTAPAPDAPDAQRRFGGIARLYGDAGLRRLQAAHMVVIGVGGVGSWAAEALARSGVGELTLIDLDHVAESNINRQAQALDSTLGQAKVRALARRLLDINPECRVHEVEEFITAENLAELLPRHCDMLLDCCDQVRAKAAVAAHALRARTPIVVSGAAGGKRLAQHVRIADLADVRGDPLLSKLRYRMRREHEAPRHGPIGLPCVHSDEPQAALLAPEVGVLLDCCDQVRAKAAMAAHALRVGLPIVLSGAAGGKRLAQHVRVMDLADVRGDPLLAKLRYRMRREHAAPRHGAIGLPCVCSDEPRAALLADAVCAAPTDAGAGLNCAGYGSSVMVTASFGMAAAGLAVETLALRRDTSAASRPRAGARGALCYD